MNTDAPAGPTEEDWATLGFHDVTELGGGWQSRVFAVSGPGGAVAVKLTQARLVDRQVFERKMALVADLARIDTSVVASVSVCGSTVYPFREWLVTAADLVDGNRPDESNSAHGELLGASLAGLHRSMRELPTVDIPRVAALTSETRRRWDDAKSDQLLHGDFNVSNVILTDAGIRIFDFDDCGYGPIEFDVANSLYMVLFDSWTRERSTTTFQRFRSAFVGEYSRSADRTLDDDIIDSLIDLRVMALQRWVANPSEAPIGIRNSPAEWIETLGQFVREWFSGDRMRR